MEKDKELLPVVLNNKIQKYKMKHKKKYIVLGICIIACILGKMYLDYSKRTFVFSEYKKLQDTNNPVITLKGKQFQNICPKETYLEEGYTAIDLEDGDITDKVQISSLRDKNLEYITYTVKDEFNNLGYETRIIDYADYIKPDIKIIGREKEKIIHGSNYIDQKVDISDNKDNYNTLFNYLTEDSNININVPGKYYSNFTLQDSSGNKNNLHRELEILDNTKKENPIIFLTFDDGPCVYTEKLLNILKENDVKATFFISGNMPRYNHLIKRMHEEGHGIGLHSNSHIYKQIYSSENAFINDLNVVSNLVFTQANIRPKIFRFAGGSSNTVSKNYNAGIMTRLDKKTKQLGYTYIDWNVDSMDTSKGITPEKIKQNILNNISNKQYSIVLQHDIHINSVNAVDGLIKEAKARGYRFEILDENAPIYQQRIVN